MGDKSAIEWTEATWNPIAGCSVTSPGCANCYAMGVAGGRLRSSRKYRGLTEPSKAGPVWNGDMRLWEKALDQPLRWKKPRRIFVNSMSDLFHQSIPDAWIDRIFGVMAVCKHHRFQVLTKRAERMRDYLRAGFEAREDRNLGARWAYAAAAVLGPGKDIGPSPDFPLPNVWLGVSVEDQPRADERIPLLLGTPAAVRWVSAEPLLGPVDLAVPLGGVGGVRLDWVVAGSESGPGARACDLDWVRALRDQCSAAGVAFFWKQHAVSGRKISTPELDGRRWLESPI